MGKLINSGDFGLPPPTALPMTDEVLPNVIIGDEAFALTTSMMKPYPRQQSLNDRSKTIYNYRHCRARRTTENAFGIMASYFRIFHTSINTKPSKIDKIILASCILHNMMRSERIAAPMETTFGTHDSTQLPAENLLPMANAIGRPQNEGHIIREKFKEYFVGIGAVEWQDRAIQ